MQSILAGISGEESPLGLLVLGAWLLVGEGWGRTGAWPEAIGFRLWRLRGERHSEQLAYGGRKRIWAGKGKMSGSRWLRMDSAKRRAKLRADPKLWAKARMRLPCRIS